MTDIVFDPSAEGSLRMALSHRGGAPRRMGVGVCLSGEGEPTAEELREAQRRAEEEVRREWAQAVPLEGSPGDVFSFGLGLSMGDISRPEPAFRREMLSVLLAASWPEGAEERAAELTEQGERNLRAVLDRAQRGDTLRIWYSQQPDELCGLCWLMEQLGEAGTVTLVALPPWTCRGDQLVCCQGWGEVSPARWGRYASGGVSAQPVLRRALGARWRELRAENGPLRAVVNGRLHTMPAELYDPFLRRELAELEEVFSEGELIGRVLGRHQLKISDGWLALRVEELIRAGELIPLEEAPPEGPAYRRKLKKVRR